MEDAHKHVIINPESFHAAALMASTSLAGTAVLTAKILTNACQVMVSAPTYALTLRDLIVVNAPQGSFWIQMEDLARIMMNVCWDTMAASKSVTISLEASTALATRDMNSTKTTGLVQM